MNPGTDDAPNLSNQLNDGSPLWLLQGPDTTNQQSFAASRMTALTFCFHQLVGFTSRVAASVNSVSVGTASVSASFGNKTLFEDAVFIDFVEARNLWRAAKCPSGMELRTVWESELTKGWKDLKVTADCRFKTYVETPRKKERPVEVPMGLFSYVMRALGHDAAYKGDRFFVYGPRMKRPIKSIICIAPEVDHFGENRDVESAGAVFEDHVLKSSIHVTEEDKVTYVVHNIKTFYRSIPMTDRGRKVVRGKLRSRKGYMVLI